jgi:hypothetical protein
MFTTASVGTTLLTGSPDAGIELARVDGIKLYHNTVWREDVRGRGIRCIEKLHNVDIANNLIRGSLALMGEEKSRNNVVGLLDNWFQDPPTGDLRLVGLASDAIDHGVALREVRDDIDANPRDSHPDIGADELVAEEEGDSQPSVFLCLSSFNREPTATVSVTALRRVADGSRLNKILHGFCTSHAVHDGRRCKRSEF